MPLRDKSFNFLAFSSSLPIIEYFVGILKKKKKKKKKKLKFDKVLNPELYGLPQRIYDLTW